MSEYKYSSYNEFLGKKEFITPESIKILFSNSDNFLKDFKLIHNTSSSEEFIDIKEKNINDFIIEYETENNIKIANLSKNKIMLKKFILQARKETDVKIVELAKILGISKSSVGNIINNATKSHKMTSS